MSSTSPPTAPSPPTTIQQHIISCEEGIDELKKYLSDPQIQSEHLITSIKVLLDVLYKINHRLLRGVQDKRLNEQPDRLE